MAFAPAFASDAVAAGSGSSAGGGEHRRGAAGGGGALESPAKTPKAYSGRDWWKSLHGKGYPLTDGSVLEFKLKGNDLICEWGRLEYGKSGVPARGRLRMECMNCRHPYGVDMQFDRDFKTVRAYMGHMGTLDGKLGRVTPAMRLAGPSGE